MRKLFNFYDYEAKNEWFTYQNIFNILKAVGYHTVWLSNQESNVFSSVGPSAVYSHLCDFRKFTEEFNDEHFKSSSNDGNILPMLDDAMKETHEKNFYLIHLIGTHYHYHKRYPKKFGKFSPDDEDVKKTSVQRRLLAHYDNAILYNDFIIDEIIKRFEDKNAILFYISDHGEGVFDKSDLIGHAPINDPNMIEIPFLIWLSEKFRTAYPDIEKRIAASVHRPYMTDDLIHTILDISGIETPDYDPERSVINEKFNSSRPRIFMNFIYDKEKGLNEIQ